MLLVARLTDSVSSRMNHSGDQVSAVVVSPAVSDGRIVIPRGSRIFGSIGTVHRVGAGIVHERASVSIIFRRWESEDGVVHPLAARLTAVDNAREQVNSDGRITGILAAGGAPGFLLGMWSRPTDEYFLRVASGLAGFAGFVGRTLDFDPVGIAGLTALRLAVVPAAEPEIWFPRGTDLVLSLTRIPPGHYADEPAPEPAPFQLQSWSESITVQTTRSRADTPDITNVVFFGSASQIINAFAAAGWSEPEPLSRRSALRFYQAISAQRGYANAPMSTLLLNEKPPDLEFEKSLNTVARRHHVRVWQQGTYDGSQAWAAAGTHDIGVRMTGRGFTHEIDPHIDRERDWIIDDLAFAGCVQQVQFVERPALAAFTGDRITDGRMAVIQLHDCDTVPATDPPPHQAAGARLFRRLVLEARYTVLRGNVYYWAWQGMRHVWIRERQANTQTGEPRLAIAAKSVPAAQ